jgi:fumarate reductase subunit C
MDKLRFLATYIILALYGLYVLLYLYGRDGTGDYYLVNHGFLGNQILIVIIVVALADLIYASTKFSATEKKKRARVIRSIILNAILAAFFMPFPILLAFIDYLNS